MLDRPIINHSTIENAIRMQYICNTCINFLRFYCWWALFGDEEGRFSSSGSWSVSIFKHSLSQFVTTPSPVSLSSRRSPYLLCERSHRDRDDTHRTCQSLRRSKVGEDQRERERVAFRRSEIRVYGEKRWSLIGRIREITGVSGDN